MLLVWLFQSPEHTITQIHKKRFAALLVSTTGMGFEAERQQNGRGLSTMSMQATKNLQHRASSVRNEQIWSLAGSFGAGKLKVECPQCPPQGYYQKYAINRCCIDHLLACMDLEPSQGCDDAALKQKARWFLAPGGCRRCFWRFHQSVTHHTIWSFGHFGSSFHIISSFRPPKGWEFPNI